MLTQFVHLFSTYRLLISSTVSLMISVVNHVVAASKRLSQTVLLILFHIVIIFGSNRVCCTCLAQRPIWTAMNLRLLHILIDFVRHVSSRSRCSKFSLTNRSSLVNRAEQCSVCGCSTLTHSMLLFSYRKTRSLYDVHKKRKQDVLSLLHQ